jgi:[protein-PII] uridylyltransferase
VSERPAPVGRLLEDLRSLDRAYSTGHHGRWSGRRRAELVDACIRDLASDARMPEDVALVALGGYGRGVLAPGSDVDLLILQDGSSTPDVAALAEHLLYPLWDAGLRVGHAVRTPSACVEIAAERLDATTAMLDGRVVAGSESSWDDVRSALLDLVRSDPRAFAERLAADREARRHRFGSVSSLLEPELKEGVGGLRDVHALAWLQTAIGRPLEGAGILRESERRSVEGAEEFLTRVRGALHLEVGRGSDRLLAEQQPPVAAAMGFVDEPGLPAVDGLMRSVFEQARQVEHVSASVLDRFLRGSSPPLTLDATPDGILRAFAEVARDRDVMPAASLDALAAVSIDADLPWTEPVSYTQLTLPTNSRV